MENRGNIWCNFMHLKISVMRLQVRAFKNCNNRNTFFCLIIHLNEQCNFEKILSDVNQLRSTFLVILGDFNARWLLLLNPLSCIDLIFTEQTNLVVGSGIHLLLHPNCHHEITYRKSNLFIWYAPPYAGQVWDANSNKLSLNQVNWDQLF